MARYMHPVTSYRVVTQKLGLSEIFQASLVVKGELQVTKPCKYFVRSISDMG